MCIKIYNNKKKTVKTTNKVHPNYEQGGQKTKGPDFFYTESRSDGKAYCLDTPHKRYKHYWSDFTSPT